VKTLPVQKVIQNALIIEQSSSHVHAAGQLNKLANKWDLTWHLKAFKNGDFWTLLQT